MMRDRLLSKRIMLQFVQNGQFSAVTREEAYHVALLKDKGFVEATVECDAAGTPIKATIGRLTSSGHDAIETDLSSADEAQDSIITPQDYYKLLVENKHGNEVARDRMLATIATGGIALLFAIASYLKTNNMLLPLFPWLITLTAWTLVLVGLMFSSHLGGRAIDGIIEKLSAPNADVMHKRVAVEYFLGVINVLNCVGALIGVGTFAWFLLIIV